MEMMPFLKLRPWIVNISTQYSVRERSNKVEIQRLGYNVYNMFYNHRRAYTPWETFWKPRRF